MMRCDFLVTLMLASAIACPASSAQLKQCKTLITTVASVKILYKASGEGIRQSERNARNAAAFAARIKWTNLAGQSFGSAYSDIKLANDFNERCAKTRGDYNCYANGFPCRVDNRQIKGKIPARKLN